MSVLLDDACLVVVVIVVEVLQSGLRSYRGTGRVWGIRMKIERGAQCFGRPIVSKERQILQKQGLTSFLNMKH